MNLKLLRQYVAEGKITECERGKLSLFNYTVSTQFNNEWDEVTLACRGLVWNTATDRIIARPFNKFFNFGERTKHLPDPTDAIIMEKYDGCLGICFWYYNQWHITTRGSFFSEQGLYATKRFLPLLKQSEMSPMHTYLFEIVFKDRIIGALKYDYEGLVLLGIRETSSGVYSKHSRLPDEAKIINAIPPKIYSAFADKSYVQSIYNSTDDREGVVIVYPDGRRLKFKTEKYKVLHHLYHGISDKQLATAIAEDRFREIIINVPEEYRDVIETRVVPIKEYRDTIYKEVQKHLDSLSHLQTQRDFAIAVQKTVPKYLQGACFQLKQRGKLKSVYLRKMLISKINKDAEESS